MAAWYVEIVSDPQEASRRRILAQQGREKEPCAIEAPYIRTEIVFSRESVRALVASAYAREEQVSRVLKLPFQLRDLPNFAAILKDAADGRIGEPDGRAFRL
ncbi:hypothetical protein CKO28_17415 [Rhodovibrio sodomensis]|uniref:NusG-like N-terminal domain-containing protein n=1 Tax=Rhodovibrio sodomensis TaxID=1088 RepID=A0ABS1DIQ9_9PROT|nr:hypothetical protein [Rhodovibrio sodomensis]MBK1669817.1 hypothetical protein [Rhodovibrio sodomensis]